LAAIGPTSRLALHRDVTARGVDKAIEAFKMYFAGK
jgi:hypothetical protein